MSCYPVLYFEREVKALVLCGGLSTRMGTDKGLLRTKEGVTWAEKPVKACELIGVDTFVSINASQEVYYKHLFREEQLIKDMSTGIGPLSGILSAYDKFPTSDWLIMSCDMIDMDVEMLYEVLMNTERLAEYDAAVSSKDGFFQPFPGLYSAEFLSKTFVLYQTRQLEGFSLQTLFKSFYTYELQLSPENKLKMKSYNSHKDL